MMVLYKINIYKTHTQSGSKKSLFQFCLTVTEPFSPFYLEDIVDKGIKKMRREIIQLWRRRRRNKNEKGEG